jgi:hypothetical protein
MSSLRLPCPPQSLRLPHPLQFIIHLSSMEQGLSCWKRTLRVVQRLSHQVAALSLGNCFRQPRKSGTRAGLDTGDDEILRFRLGSNPILRESKN